MNKLERWVLRSITRRAVIQGHDHARNIEEYFSIIVKEAREQFTEDNKPTIDGFLRDRFERSLEEPMPTYKHY